jgi:MoxR-like ATPase
MPFMGGTKTGFDEKINRITEAAEGFTENVGRVIVGKKEAIRSVFIGLLCGGHLLIEDVPGVGKTLLAKAAARSLGCTFKRIQCTPDLLPADVTGLHYFNQKSSEFEFRPGPILANFVLVDEINRAMPRTQSCLLECMQEQQVTVDWHTFLLPRPFLILATQNPIELEGTFPLPEAQLDRFLLRVKLGYPAAEEEEGILTRFQETNPLDSLSAILEMGELLELQSLSRRIFVEPSVRGYITSLTRATRNHADIRLGASPRSSLGLHSAAQAFAALQGRNFVIPDDVKSLAIPVLAHRLLLKAETRMRGKNEEEVLREILDRTPVPLEGPA